MEGGRWWTFAADFFEGSITGSAVSVLNDVNAGEIGYLLGFIQKAPEGRSYGTVLVARLLNCILIPRKSKNVYPFSDIGDLSVTRRPGKFYCHVQQLWFTVMTPLCYKNSTRENYILISNQG
jgi:hypothetical protein